MKLINKPLVSVDWLKSNLNAPSLKLVDASWFMPGTPRDGFEEWKQKRIPGSVYFDYDKRICDHSSSLPHMLPTPAFFAEEVSLLGINNDDDIVVYDSAGIFSAPRVWWMFKVMAHENVAVLDGGLPAWENAGGAIDTSAPSAIAPSTYVATFDASRVIDKHALLDGLTNGSVNAIDVRPHERFLGTAPEPRPGVRSGHMPNAVNLPFASLLEEGKFKAEGVLAELVERAIDDDKRNVASCGSGVTACILALASEQALNKPVTVYDGSWTEWGGDHDLPIVQGE